MLFRLVYCEFWDLSSQKCRVGVAMWDIWESTGSCNGDPIDLISALPSTLPGTPKKSCPEHLGKSVGCATVKHGSALHQGFNESVVKLPAGVIHLITRQPSAYLTIWVILKKERWSAEYFLYHSIVLSLAGTTDMVLLVWKQLTIGWTDKAVSK